MKERRQSGVSGGNGGIGNILLHRKWEKNNLFLITDFPGFVLQLVF
jgi:hypothetical protein